MKQYKKNVLKKNINVFMKWGIVIVQRLEKFVHNSVLSFHQTFLFINCAMWSLGLWLIYYRMEYSQRMSEVLYVGLCRDKRIGTPTEVAIRREMMDMEEIIERPVYIHRGCMIMKSGSHREGFRFTSCAGHQISDWFVINLSSQSSIVLMPLEKIFFSLKVQNVFQDL